MIRGKIANTNSPYESTKRDIVILICATNMKIARWQFMFSNMNGCRNLWWGVSHLGGVWVDKMMHLMLSNRHYSFSSTLIANINGGFLHAKLSSTYILDWNNLSLALFLADIRFLTGENQGNICEWYLERYFLESPENMISCNNPRIL